MYQLTEKERRLIKTAPTVASAPHGVAGCGRKAFGMVCTLMAGHTGPHIAHGFASIPCRVWQEQDETTDKGYGGNE